MSFNEYFLLIYTKYYKILHYVKRNVISQKMHLLWQNSSKILFNHLNDPSSTKGVSRKERVECEQNLSCIQGIEPMIPSLSHQHSSHRATTTDHHALILFVSFHLDVNLTLFLQTLKTLVSLFFNGTSLKDKMNHRQFRREQASNRILTLPGWMQAEHSFPLTIFLFR